MNTYRVKVRRRTYLWGGEGVLTTFNSSSSLFIHFRVDETGEEVRFGVLQQQGRSLREMGTLKPGEGFTIGLNGIVGVYASLDDPKDTYVDCTIISSNQN
jgi:hypothetical protein